MSYQRLLKWKSKLSPSETLKLGDSSNNTNTFLGGFSEKSPGGKQKNYCSVVVILEEPFLSVTANRRQALIRFQSKTSILKSVNM